MRKALAITFAGALMMGIWAYMTQGSAEAKKEVKNISSDIGQPISSDAGTIETYDDVPLSEDMQIYMQEVCQENNVSYEFALALMESESGFQADAIGDGGKSVGYFQIHLVNWERMESEYALNVHDPKDNIKAGIVTIRELFEKYEDPYKVIICYKAGDKRGSELFAQEKYKTSDYDCEAICGRAMELERNHGK